MPQLMVNKKNRREAVKNAPFNRYNGSFKPFDHRKNTKEQKQIQPYF